MLTYNELNKLTYSELFNIYKSLSEGSYKKLVSKAMLEVQGRDILASLLTGPAVIRRYY